MAGSELRTHYQVLGVPRNATAAEIRRAHRQLAQLLHPDRQGSSSPAERGLAERRMREVNAAWTVLSDPARRRAYDDTIREPAAASRSAGTSSSSRGASRERPGRPLRPEDSDDPDRAFADARVAELDPDEPPLSRFEYHLLRRGPVLFVAAAVFLLLVFTAYAGSGSDGQSEPTGLGAQGASTIDSPHKVGSDMNCVNFIDAQNSVRTDCNQKNDGRITKSVERALDCRAPTRYALLNNGFVCVAPPTEDHEQP